MRRRLRRLRRSPKARWAAVVAVAVLVLGIGLAVQLGKNPAGGGGSNDGRGGTALPSDGAPGTTGTATEKSAVKTTIKGVPRTVTEELYYPVTGLDIHTLPPHHLVLTVTSTGSSVARVGYLVPTSEDNPYGDSKDAAAPWSRSFEVYGPGKYALIFLQSDASGASLTCTVSVDGKVVSSHTTHGAYGRGYCIG